jgi:PAS domain S-box-containing protein
MEDKGYDTRQFFENSLDMLCIAGFDGYFKRINRAWSRTLGHSAESLMAVPYLSFVHPEDVGPTLKEAEKLGTGGDTICFENRYRCSDGYYKWLLWRATPDLKRQIIYASAQDITDRRSAEDELLAAKAELERSNADLEQFAYIASHDLKEPLRMVTSYLGLIQKRYQSRLDAEADEFIEFAVDGAARMRRLIDELLLYSRVGRNKRPYELVDVNAVVQGVLDNLRLTIKDEGAIVKVGTLPAIFGDAGELGQLFQNLIANALKFRSTAPPVIEVEAQRAEKDWIFSVQDNGIGIAPKYFDRIFVIFQRLHTPEKYPGSGMGLAICKKIVDRHGGRIWVESEAGSGARFSFRLPCAKGLPKAATDAA